MSVTGVAEAIRSWRENGDQLYQLAGSATALLVVTAIACGRRPTEVLASIAGSVGAEHVARWLTTDAIPVLATTNPGVSSVVMTMVVLVSVIMVFTPLWRDHRTGLREFDHPVRLIGSRSACTVWGLLLVAAQAGDIRSVLAGWVEVLWNVGVWTAGIVLAGAVLHEVSDRWWVGTLARPLLSGLGSVLRWVTVGVAAAFTAIVFVALSLPLAIVRWLIALEPEMRHGDRATSEPEPPMPTGAVMTRLDDRRRVSRVDLPVALPPPRR